ncbi:MAG: hypothetical protein D6743_10615 [Calditrichaeota bacterium]|nr:MAG: hypothetical protein D6743_10615 [Calditrichota bacterium]
MKKDCTYFGSLITGYVDGELDDKKVLAVRAHLKDCKRCNESYLDEVKLKNVLKERVLKTRAPGYLRNRIRRQIFRYGERPSFAELIQSLFAYRPIHSTLALAAIAIVVFFSTYELVQPLSPHTRQASTTGVSLKSGQLHGEIICLDCELLSHTTEGFVHDPKTHHAGLQADDGSIWTFMHSPAGENIPANRNYLKKKAVVSGILFTNAHYIQVEELKLL